MTYNKWNNLLGWFCGVIASTVYLLTMDQYNSWWDTGEFIASAYKLEIVHQPGAPLFLMIQNIFSNLALGNVDKIAFYMNVGSALCSGMTIVFLFWTITALAKKILITGRNKSFVNSQLLVFTSGIVGALAYSFTDTFWYSAVESEVYAMSSLCTAVVFWMILKWEARADDDDANRWLLAIAFVMGLSIGVHLLNLLTIPALALVVYFRKTKTVTRLGVIKTLGIGVVILAFVLWGIIQYSVKFAAYFDLFFVNTLGLGFGTGIVFFILLIVSLLVGGLYYTVKKHKKYLQLSLLAICFVLFGFSSYTMLIIRAQTNISLNNASPDNAFSFLGYLSREQYGSEPLVKGPVYNSNIKGVETSVTYRKDADKYNALEVSNRYSYDKEMLFPRIYSEKHSTLYQYYLGLTPASNPSFWHNMQFFFQYQINHMYLRYFFWNFIGRQNDVPGHGGVLHGNWISGIKTFDNLLVGPAQLSDAIRFDNSRNTYFFLPLILGILGLVWQYRKHRSDTFIVGLLFFFTGLAIVIYLNQTPMQPRERDYAYAGSFYFFSIWIGLGVLGLMACLRRLVNHRIASRVAMVLALLGGPMVLIIQNWDDHDRSDREWTRDMAYNYLESCEPNAILFTYADNDTFPLWYLQEVENVRPDVRVINLSYLQSDWYLKQAMQDINEAKAAPIDIPYDKVKKGVRDVIYVHDLGVERFTDVDTLLKIMLSDDQSNQMQMRNGSFVNILPTKKLMLAIDKDTIIRNAVVPKVWEGNITEEMRWLYNKEYVSKAELGLMAILVNNKWERPIYFANMLSTDNFMGLDKYLVNEGLVYKLMPVELGQKDGQVSLVNEDSLYRNITTKFRWGNIANIRHFDSDYRTFVNNYLWEETVGMALDTLNRKGKFTQAKHIADIAMNNMPQKIVNTQQAFINTFVVDTLLNIEEGDKERGIMLANTNLEYLEQQLDYLNSVKNAMSGFDIRELQLAADTLDRYRWLADKYQNRELLAKVNVIDQKNRNQ